jgi:hypothetical protein
MRLLAQRPRVAQEHGAGGGKNLLSEIDYSANGTASTVGAAAAKALEERLDGDAVQDTHN